MEHIAALLLIVGCSNNLTQCRELPVSVSVFETMAECSAERPFAVGDLADPAKRIFSRCLAVDPALEDDYNEIAWNVRPDGTFEASVEISGVMVASDESHAKDGLRRE
ncbi:MAG TPA: hypothetical protein VGM46_10755 [Mesorhizobium sp.]